MDFFSNVIFNTWQFWLVTSVVLFIIEIFTPGFFLATFAIGALCAALTAFLTDNFNVQMFVFAVTTTLTFVFVRPFAKKYFFKKSPDLPTNADALAGKKAKVIETVDNANSKGRVKLFGGEDWKAVSADESIIEKDTVVEIVSVDGAKATVKKI
ncbi:MAG TPA: NfeD family protein [bacterium]|nr:NfeD family protein [bacterium]